MEPLLTLISWLLLATGVFASNVDCMRAAADTRSHHINETNLTTVTVFVDRAEVTRTLHVHLNTTGSFTLLLEGLPEKLETGSVRVDGIGPDLEIFDVSDLANISSEESLAAIAKEIDAADSELVRLETNVTRLHFMMGLLENYTKSRLGVTPFQQGSDGGQMLGLEAAAETFEFYSTRSAQLHQELWEVNEAKAHLAKKRSEAKQAYTSLQRSGVRVAVIHAALGEASSCQILATPTIIALTIRYVVRGASWSPSYDFQARSDQNAVELIYYGNVLQATGEDWENIRLSLSTSDPSRPVSPPLARQRSIHFRENFRSEGECDGSPEACYLSRPRRAKQAKLNAAAGSVLEIPRLVSVPQDPGGGTSRRITIGTFAMSARFTHYATPTVSPHAYLRATMNNSSPYPLLPSSGGKVRVFFEGRFVATSELSGVVGVNATFMSFLGVDHSVKIHIDPEVQRFQSSLLGGAVTTFTSGTRVSNRRDSELYIVIQDRIVQSMTDKIAVEVVSPSELVNTQADADPFEFSPGQSRAHLDNKTGAINWAACIGPRSEMTFPLIFSATTARGRYVSVIEGGTIQFDRSSDAHMEL